MIVDAHAHLVTPMAVWGIRTMLQTSGGQHSKEYVLNRYLQQADMEASIANNIAIMDKVGTDIQCLSPRPFTLMHSHQRFEDIDVWVALQNNLIHRCIEKHPTRFRGVAALPQMAGQPIEIVFPELERVVNELGFIGVLVNPDPYEGTGPSPRLGDPYWYPALGEVHRTQDPGAHPLCRLQRSRDLRRALRNRRESRRYLAAERSRLRQVSGPEGDGQSRRRLDPVPDRSLALALARDPGRA